MGKRRLAVFRGTVGAIAAGKNGIATFAFPKTPLQVPGGGSPCIVGRMARGARAAVSAKGRKKRPVGVVRGERAGLSQTPAASLKPTKAGGGP